MQRFRMVLETFYDNPCDLGVLEFLGGTDQLHCATHLNNAAEESQAEAKAKAFR